MNGPIPVVIPSHRRAATTTTNRAVTNCILCVEEAQAGAYREHNPSTEIVAHPDTVIGMLPKRQWMRMHFGSHFSLDDDLDHMTRLYVGPGEDARVPPDVAYELIQNLAMMADEMGVKLFGFSKNPKPLMYNGSRPFAMKGLVLGGWYGIFAEDKFYWPVDLAINDDFWISLLNAYHYRKCLIDDRFTFVTKATFKNPGGMADIRTVDAERRDYELLRRYFGDAIVCKSLSPHRNMAHAYEKTIQLPY